MMGRVFMRVVAVGALIVCLAGGVRADNLEYRYEVGIMVGGSCYYGDANYSSLMKNMNLYQPIHHFALKIYANLNRN